MEDGGGVAKDEIHRAGDSAFFVELPHGVRVEAVLVAGDGTSEEHGEVGVGSQGYCLVFLWACRVLEGDASCYESSTTDSKCS